ncbi:unnamed protein product [Closterium sp. NIES-53]
MPQASVCRCPICLPRSGRHFYTNPSNGVALPLGCRPLSSLPPTVPLQRRQLPHGSCSGESNGVVAAAAAAVSVGASGESRGGVSAAAATAPAPAAPAPAPAAAAAVSVGASGESRGGVTAAAPAPVPAAAAVAVSVGASGESRGGVPAAAAAAAAAAVAAAAAAAVSVGASGEGREIMVAASTVPVGASGENRAGVPPAAAGAGTDAADARGGGAAATATARPARPSTCTLEPRRSRYRADGPFHLILRSRVASPLVLLQPPESSLAVLHDLLSDYIHASRHVVSRVLSALVTHPTAPLLCVSALVTTVDGFASSHRLDYAAHLVSGPARSPSCGGALVLSLEVSEDRQFELGFLAAAVPHL